MYVVVENIGIIKICPSNESEKKAFDDMFTMLEKNGIDIKNTKFCIEKDGGFVTQLLITPSHLL